MKRLVLFVAALGLVACGPSGGPSEGPLVVSLFSLQPPPIYALLGYRDRLQLTSLQVTSLDSIAQQVQDANRPIMRRLQDPEADVKNAEARTLVEQVRGNNRQASDGVRAVLNAEQQRQTCDLFKDTPGSAGDDDRQRPRSGQRSGTRRRRSAADSLAMRPQIVWTWCTPATPATPPRSR